MKTCKKCCCVRNIICITVKLRKIGIWQKLKRVSTWKLCNYNPRPFYFLYKHVFSLPHNVIIMKNKTKMKNKNNIKKKTVTKQCSTFSLNKNSLKFQKKSLLFCFIPNHTMIDFCLFSSLYCKHDQILSSHNVSLIL